MSLLPARILPQTEPFGTTDEKGIVTIDKNWWLLLYNLCAQVLGTGASGGAGGGAPISPADLLNATDDDFADALAATRAAFSASVLLAAEPPDPGPSLQGVSNALLLALAIDEEQNLNPGFLGLANPTAKVGLNPVFGVAHTGMRSDGAPALDQTISPAWLGEHFWVVQGSATGITVSNTGTGDGIYINNNGPGVGLTVFSTTAGTAFAAANNSTGPAIDVTQGGTILQALSATSGAFAGAITGAAGLTISAGNSALQAVTATDLSIGGAGSLVQLGSAKFAWYSNQYAIDLGAASALRADSAGTIELDSNLYYGAGPGWLYKSAGPGASFAAAAGAFTWNIAPAGAAGAAATLSNAMTLNAGGLSVAGGVQAVGYAVSSGIGVELGYTGGMGYLQAYNHTSSVYLPLTIACTTLAFSQLATSATAPAAGGAGALPATPAGYLAVTIAGTARRIPYYT